jgi:formylglycine-generating enzyme required for sulfatase activity
MSLVGAPNLARIPRGAIFIGARTDDGRSATQPIFVEEFSIGRFPVTHEEYAAFVRATGYPAPSVRALPLVAANGRDAVFRDLARPYVWQNGEPPADLARHPVVLVRYEDCVEYCRWLSAELDRVVRLPAGQEWEKAARGGADRLRYPWGDTVDSTKANFLTGHLTKATSGTTPAGVYPPNAFGLYDMIGNVWEWTSEREGGMRIVRGGSWVNSDVDMLRSDYRHKVPDDTYAYSIGFRIVCTE